MGEIKLSTLHETGVNTSIVLHPEWAFESERKMTASHLRTTEGLSFTYLWSNVSAYRVPLRYVPDSQRTLLHQWWREKERLLFTLDTSLDNTNTLCRIVNRQSPLTARIAGHLDLWSGMMHLEAVDSRSRLGYPLILDDPIWGRLDQSNISLI
jgi:hypothetical protein